MPKKAQKTVERIGASVTKCDREFMTGKYEVTLSNGIEIEFTSKGEIDEIEAPDNTVLGNDIIKEIVPGHLYDNLKEMKALELVTSIEATRLGYKVDFAGTMDEAYFNAKGDLISMHYDD